MERCAWTSLFRLGESLVRDREESAQEVKRRDAGQIDVRLAFTADKSDMMPATASRSWDS